MTKVNVNEMFESLSGKYGKKHVLRNLSGKTILAKRPAAPGMMTTSQAGQRTRFGEAIEYAVFVRDDLEKWQRYVSRKVPGKSAFNLAVGDYLTSPEIQKISTGEYLGHPGGKIIVTAVDKFEVCNVLVRINGPDGTLIEEGPAPQRDGTGYFAYLTTQENPILSGSVITATAYDNPGHAVTATAMM
jgi:hypothetical protein